MMPKVYNIYKGCARCAVGKKIGVPEKNYKEI